MNYKTILNMGNFDLFRGIYIAKYFYLVNWNFKFCKIKKKISR